MFVHGASIRCERPALIPGTGLHVNSRLPHGRFARRGDHTPRYMGAHQPAHSLTRMAASLPGYWSGIRVLAQHLTAMLVSAGYVIRLYF